MTLRHLAIVMPAYNESEGIRDFIDEIRLYTSSVAHRVSFHIEDDQSTDETANALRGIEDVALHIQPVNRGHGPTALAAYRAGLAAGPDVVVHVDGDGQFQGQDVRRLVLALVRERADVVHGVRHGRIDPWYRVVLTAAVGMAISVVARKRIPDVNTPLRAYRPQALRALLEATSPEATIPHVHFSLAEARAAFVVRYLYVSSIPRRGSSPMGTMWGRQAGVALPPKRLRSFVRSALTELWRLSLRPSAKLRLIVRPEGDR